jgi:hypothetical protein
LERALKKKENFDPKECKKCGRIFTPWNIPQKYCGDPCKIEKRRTIADMNAAWGLRDGDYHNRRYKHVKDNFIRGDVRLI